MKTHVYVGTGAILGSQTNSFIIAAHRVLGLSSQRWRVTKVSTTSPPIRSARYGTMLPGWQERRPARRVGLLRQAGAARRFLAAHDHAWMGPGRQLWLVGNTAAVMRRLQDVRPRRGEGQRRVPFPVPPDRRSARSLPPVTYQQHHAPRIFTAIGPSAGGCNTSICTSRREPVAGVNGADGDPALLQDCQGQLHPAVVFLSKDGVHVTCPTAKRSSRAARPLK